MTQKLALGVSVLLSIALAACGGDDETGITSRSVVALEPCAHGSGSNWSAQVSGISCDEVGRFIEQEIFGKREVQISQENSFESAGFNCDVSERPARGGWRVSCDQADRHFVFNWTP